MAADDDALTEPMRVAFAGDWHGNTAWAVNAVEFAASRDVDTMVHAGDFAYLFYPRFVRPLNRALERRGMQLLFVDGNHDDHRMLAGLPMWPSGIRQVADRIWYLPRGFRWEWGGVRFLGLGGAHSVDRPWRLREGHSWWPEERITTAQAELAAAGGIADVMISHDCPAGVDIPGIEESAGWFPADELAAADTHRALLAGVVEQVRPRLLIHGHYHRRYTANVEDDPQRPMRVIGLDMDGTTMLNNMVIFDLPILHTFVTNPPRRRRTR